MSSEVKVKLLEWRANAKGEAAQTVIGTYWVFEHDGEWFWARGTRLVAPGRMMVDRTAAKAAAQADYEQRILSALLSQEAQHGQG